MRHKLYGKKLGRNKDERTALFKSLVQELFLHGTITTTESKAKAVKGLVDKIINLAKSKNTQRLLQAYFSNKLLLERLIKEIAPKMENRTSGYTSLLRMGKRLGDQAMMVTMSLIGMENLKPIEKVKSEKGKVVSQKKEVAKKATPVKKAAAKKTIGRRRVAK